LTAYISKNRKKAAAFLLILFVLCCLISYKQEAEAIAPVIAAVAVAGVALCAYTLVVGGLTFAQTGDLQTAANSMYNQFQDKINTAITSGRLVYSLATGGYKWVANVAETDWLIIKEWIFGKYNVGANYDSVDMNLINGQWYNFHTSTKLVCQATNDGVYKIYDYLSDGHILRDTYRISTGLPVSIGTNIYNFDKTKEWYIRTVSTGGYEFRLYNGLTYYSGTAMSWGNGTNWYYSFDAPDILNGAIGIQGIIDNPAYDWDNTQTGMKDISIPLENDQVGLPQITAQVGSDTIGLSVPTGILEDIKTLTPTDVKTQDLTGVNVSDTSISVTQEGVTDFPADYTNTDETTKDLKALIMTKFPFCLPWDLVNAIKLIAAEPEAPAFRIDLLEPIGHAGLAVIDFDMQDYQLVGQVIRWVSLVEFSFMLILATRKLIWG